MKKYIFILTGILFSISVSFAQNEVDALRYSQSFITGTARSAGLGGAIGALGGDFTSLSVNPAGIGLYRQSEFSFTPSLYWNTSTSDFLGNNREEMKYNFNFGNIGYVMNYRLKEGNTGLLSFSMGFGYNRTNNFHASSFMQGVNNNSSLLDNFTNYINADPENMNQFYERIAWDANLIPEDSDNPGTYFNDIENGGYSQLQRRNLDTEGSIGEYLVAFGANISNRIYVGTTIGIDRVNYRQNVIHTESDPNNDLSLFDKFIFNESLRTYGTGVNAKFGIIARPIDAIRVGLSYHIPTFYKLNDEFSTGISSFFDSGDQDLNKSSSSPLGEYGYNLRTPGRFIGSLAATFGKIGLLTADYEFVDYTKSKLEGGSDHDFYNENDAIQALYQKTNNFRLGGELRAGEAYLRGGYAFYQTPFKSVEPDISGHRNVFSGGVGFRSQLFFLDLSYSWSMQENMYYMYVPEMTKGAKLTNNMNSILMTVGFRF